VGKTHVASHATTMDAVEQKIQSEWKQGGCDIAKSLKDLEMIPIEDHRPERETSKLEADKGNKGGRTEWHGHLLPRSTPLTPSLQNEESSTVAADIDKERRSVRPKAMVLPAKVFCQGIEEIVFIIWRPKFF